MRGATSSSLDPILLAACPQEFQQWTVDHKTHPKKSSASAAANLACDHPPNSRRAVRAYDCRGGRRYSRVHSLYSGRYQAAKPTQVRDAAE